MDTSITNTAFTSGLFDGTTTGLTAAVVTLMTDELSLAKTADKQVWADGNLTYSVAVDNTSTTLPYENVVFTDTIDPTLAALVTDSVTLNGTAVAYTYDATTGLLTVNAGTIAAPGTATIAFKVSKK